MLDYRAWIVAGLILLSTAGAYLVWLKRPRAVAQTRSLSAAGQPPNAASKVVTQSLHVEGCDKDFIVKPGELVEPRVVPGAPLDRFRDKYGAETKRDKTGIWIWNRDPYLLTDGYFETEKTGNFVGISVNQGHVVETLDGIELGIDSFGTIFRKMRDRKVEIHERVDGGEGNWTLIVSFYSACGHKFRSEYSRTIPASAEVDKFILPSATGPNSGAPRSNSEMRRSDVFMNKVVYNFDLVPSNGQDESADGSPSEHN